MQFLSMFDHYYKNVCNKEVYVRMVVEKFCNIDKYISELVQVRVSKVSKNIERMRIESLLITFTTTELKSLVPWGYGVFTTTIQYAWR
jgi:hypothetical protein